MAFLVWMNVVYFWIKICHLTLYLKFTQDLVGSLSKSLVVLKTYINITCNIVFVFSDCFYLCSPDRGFSYIFSLQCLFGIDLKFLR